MNERIEKVEQEEKQKKDKRLQNEVKQKERYDRAKKKEMDATRTLTLADKKQICRYEKLPTDPSSIMTMNAEQLNSLYNSIKARRQPDAVADV